MAISCNIDARGRRIRLMMAIAFAALALLAAAAAWRWASWVALILAVCLGICAIIGFLEVRYRYCVMKGAGLRMPF